MLGTELAAHSFGFLNAPDNGIWMTPDTATQRYMRMAAKVDIKATLHSVRRYSATELITAGVDSRTAGGRLGHFAREQRLSRSTRPGCGVGSASGEDSVARMPRRATAERSDKCMDACPPVRSCLQLCGPRSANAICATMVAP